MKLIIFHQFCRSYAVKSSGPAIFGLGKKGKKGPLSSGTSTKKELEVETDTHKLVNNVCGSNIFQQGEDVKIKPDNEYPDWLWSVRTGPPKELHEMEYGSKEYWEKLKEINVKKAIQLSKYYRLKDY